MADNPAGTHLSHATTCRRGWPAQEALPFPYHVGITIGFQDKSEGMAGRFLANETSSLFPKYRMVVYDKWRNEERCRRLMRQLYVFTTVPEAGQ